MSSSSNKVPVMDRAHEPSQASAARYWGLDLLRAMAVLMVMLYHYPKAPEQMWLRALSHFGWAGVDLFFVLSGYLIASQYFSDLARGKDSSILKFYARRFYRTLPNYFLVLGLYIYDSQYSGSDLWKYFVFAQNFGVPAIFSQSWSLCIEEQFYLIFPLAIFFLMLFQARLKSVIRSAFSILLVLALVLIGIFLRYWAWREHRPDLVFAQDADEAQRLYHHYFYYPTYMRLDGLLVGVCLAGLRVYQKDLWSSWLRKPQVFLAGGLVLLGISAALFEQKFSALQLTLGYPVISLGFGAMLLAALGENSWLCRWRIPGIFWLAQLSYALYLTHALTFGWAHKLLASFGFSTTGLAMAFVGPALALTVAGLLFAAIERPFLRLRDRHFPRV